ncbi:Ribonucleotide reductase of class III (anaerobic), large subunit [hydrothermal vent metagenome]|uniref:Ribonucleotide reductase of class III (Anaerobic), large subunit n=1 Tax=hydrothermal vent metagenome TaxID=652676 RepID=A0A3B1D8Q2_9ZZZZ
MLKTKTFQSIVKRNGKKEFFDSEKIMAAIYKAGQATGEFDDEMSRNLTLRVINVAHQVLETTEPPVEDIQDIVEDVLLTSQFRKTAKAYIIYRQKHAQIRKIATEFNTGMVDQYLKKSDWKVNENSNMAFSLQGLNQYISAQVSKAYWLNNIYNERIQSAHNAGCLHVHDLGLLSVYCVGWDLQDLLLSGFQGVRGKMESKPAKHFRTVLGQIVNFFYTLQGEASGAQAFSNFDTFLAPFIRFDNLSYKEVKQALQEFVFNVNVPTRVGFQTPFTNITMDLTVPSFMKDQGVIVGGKIQNETYGDFQKEIDLLNKAFLEVMLEGDAKGRVFTFPIPTYNITKDFDWDNENVASLWEMTAKYGIPYFSNFINSDMDPEDARSMCCRLRLDNRELRKRGGGLFGSAPLTGSVGVVTINLPRIAYLSNSVTDFFARLSEQMDIAKESLEIKRKVLENFTDEGLYPYVKFYLRNMKERTEQYWKNHFSTIGLIGMNEACLNFMGEGIADKKGHDFAKDVLDFMRENLVKYQEETGNNYNLEATPAEGTAYRLAKIDKKEFGDILCANEDNYVEGAEPFYTNSTHLPVGYSDDIFEVLDLQDELQTRYTGGTVLHGFVGEKIENPEGLKGLIKIICERYKLPYFTITPTFSVCPSCGYVAGEHHQCPTCEQTTEVYSRVVGYLRPIQQWNKGKKQEFIERTTYKICK